METLKNQNNPPFLQNLGRQDLPLQASKDTSSSPLMRKRSYRSVMMRLKQSQMEYQNEVSRAEV